MGFPKERPLSPLPLDLLVGSPRVPSELSAQTFPEQILNEAEAHSTFHLFIHQRVAQDI